MFSKYLDPICLEGAREEGREEGIREERKKIIQSLLAKSFPLATISEITGYSENEITSVAQQIK